jgi:hypothetical protein
MDKPLTYLATGPTALAAGVASGRSRHSKKGISRLPGQARDALPEMLQRLEQVPDGLQHLIPGRRSRPNLSMLLPHRKRATGRRGTMKLARHLAAAASATVLAVDVISEVRRAAEARQHHAAREGASTSSSQPEPAAAKKASRTRAATSRPNASVATKKTASAKKAPSSRKAPSKRASAVKKAPAKRVATNR